MSKKSVPAALLPKAPRSYLTFAALFPEVTRAYDSLGSAVRKCGPLSEREIALVKLAISIGSRQEGSAHAHTRKAVAAGVDPDSLRHVAILSAPTIGFPPMMAAFGWIEETITTGKKKR